MIGEGLGRKKRADERVRQRLSPPVKGTLNVRRFLSRIQHEDPFGVVSVTHEVSHPG